MDRRLEDFYGNYSSRNTIDPILPGDKSQSLEKSNQSSMAQYNRIKRDVEMVVRAETYTNKDGKTYKIVKMVRNGAAADSTVLTFASTRSFSLLPVKISNLVP